MTQPQDRLTWQTFEHRAIDTVARVLIGVAKVMPYRLRVPFMGRMVSDLIGPLTHYRRRAHDHLSFIYPEKSKADIRALARACLDNAGRTLMENYSTKDFLARMASAHPEGPGFEALQDAHRANRPVILQTGHFGNYEAARAMLLARDIKPGGIYREMKNPFFHSHYVKTMEAYGAPVFPRGLAGMRGVMRHLKSGGQLVILNDQYEMGAPVLDFMGHPAKTTLSPAELALRFDALVVPFFGIRQPDGLTFRCVFEDPIPLSDPTTMTQEMNNRLAAQIHAHPEQWFWVPRRWRA